MIFRDVSKVDAADSVHRLKDKMQLFIAVQALFPRAFLVQRQYNDSTSASIDRFYLDRHELNIYGESRRCRSGASIPTIRYGSINKQKVSRLQ